MRWIRHEFFLVAVGAGVVALALFGPMLQGQMPLPQASLAGILTGQPDREVTDSIWRDRSVQAFPFHLFATTALQAGHLPLWNDLIFAGTPFFANGQSGIFSPFKALFWPLPAWLSFNVTTILQSIVAGLGMYLLGRTLGWKKPAAAVASVALILSAPFVMRLTVLSMSAAILAGHAQLAVLVTAYGLFWSLLTFKKAQRQRRVTVLFVSFVVGVMIGGVMILPMKESLDNAYREPQSAEWSQILTWKNLTRVSLKQAAGLATMVDQNILGAEQRYRGPANYLEGNLFVGPLAVLLALVSVVAWRDRRWWGTVALAGLFTVFIVFPGTWQLMGKLVPWLSVTPVWRISFLLAFSVALLAGWGMNWFIGKVNKQWFWSIPAAMVVISLWQWQGILPFTPKSMLFPPSDFMKTVKATVGDGRLWPTHGALDQYMPYDVPVIFGYDSVYPKEYLELIESNAELRKRNQLHARDLDEKLFDVTGTTALLTRDPVPAGWTFVEKGGPYTLAKRDIAVPPIHTVQKMVSSLNAADIRNIDPATTALVVGGAPTIDATAVSTITIQEKTPTKLQVRVQSSGPTALVTNLQAYPGWKVRIDGDEADAAYLRVNHSFLGAAVNQGSHTVTFEYRPRSFQIGLGLSLLGLIGLIKLLWLDRKTKTPPHLRGEALEPPGAGA